MKVYKETSLRDFEAWSGAVSTKDRIIECGKESDFESYVEELFPDGLSATALNNLLWFGEDAIFEALGITNEESEDGDNEGKDGE